MATTTEQIVSDRNETIKAIRRALTKRSRKIWSVTGGRGTSYGWIHIDAPPARRTMHARKKAGAVYDRPEDYEEYDSGQPGGSMTPADREELGKLLGLEGKAPFQGVSVPASSDYRREYLQRAEGKPVTKKAEQYWD